jgi:ATP-dependent DNA helicase DinG
MVDFKIESVFGKDGWLAKEFPGYRCRSGQKKLATAVKFAIENREHLIAEAPCGTGKTVAYGIPAALYTLEHGGTVVIATANITLQEQLIKKDIPAIAEIIEKHTGKKLTYALLKGMGNYLCLDKLQSLVDEDKVHEGDELSPIMNWKTNTGDRSELETSVSDSCWAEVNANSDDCTRRDCSYFLDCFALNARRVCPNILVTNYHLLYTDVLVQQATGGESSLLPPYSVLVLDEAHLASDIAMTFYGFKLSVANIRRACRFLFDSSVQSNVTLARSIVSSAERFFTKLQALPKDSILKEPLGFGSELANELKEATKVISKYIKEEKDVYVSTPEDRDIRDRKLARLAASARVLMNRAALIWEVAVGIPQPDNPNKLGLKEHCVYWVSQYKKEYDLNCKVVNAKQFLRNFIFAGRTVIALSATMSSPNEEGHYTLDFTANELGLEGGKYRSLIVESPFADDQMLVIVPRNLHSPKDYVKHSAEVAKLIEQVVIDLGGRTMALFTSYRALQQAHEYLFNKLGDIRILTQNELEKSRLISEFKHNSKSVILATASFWQGVDIPGQDLSCVIIEKLPFLPPTDPVVQYLNDWYKRNGRSSFQDYCIPKAVISLKQGVGRLIRTEDDYGAVVLCDNRIDTTRYGCRFRAAFPESCCSSSDGDIGDVKRFVESRGDG